MIGLLRAHLLFAMALVFGCSGQTITPYFPTEDQRPLSDRWRGAQPVPEDLPERTPQWIAALQTPTLEVTLEDSGQVALLTPFSDRSDSEAGLVRIWRAADASQIVLRDGVLIATRGLGLDVSSTFSRTLVAMLSERAPLRGMHQLYLVTGDNGMQDVTLSCLTQDVGEQRLERGTLRIPTRHVRAKCASSFGEISYDFWVGAPGHTVWQSRQWAGPDLGYVRLRLLKE